ncbi:hypothetical protein D4764_18G0000820 [Takifugu flavidus]|uniref:Uncharacterized protein n=1 Tax=Takifugu flavidus TaxID=433684 RepID=A0A5C6NQ96_9TELE|nr:hypothetical protein D4764_18G0000820 [Takifugu flavidus]
MPKPPHLAPLNAEEQWLYSELLPDGRASHPISKGEPSHPTEKAHFGRLYPSLFTTTDRCRVHITADAAPIHLSISCSILPSLVNKTPRYSSTQGRISSLTRRRHSTFFQFRPMALDLEVLIFIPAALHAAANRSSDSWRSRADDANRTTSSAKSREPILSLKKRDYHPGLPIQRHYPRCPRDVAESSQPQQPYNIQSLKELWADLIHPRGLATEEFFDYLGNFSPGDMRAYPQVPRSCFLIGRRVGGIEEVLEVFIPPIHNIPC